MNLDANLTPFTKIKSQYITQNYKLLEENIREILGDFEFANDFYIKPQKCNP